MKKTEYDPQLEEKRMLAKVFLYVTGISILTVLFLELALMLAGY